MSDSSNNVEEWTPSDWPRSNRSHPPACSQRLAGRNELRLRKEMNGLCSAQRRRRAFLLLPGRGTDSGILSRSPAFSWAIFAGRATEPRSIGGQQGWPLEPEQWIAYAETKYQKTQIKSTNDDSTVRTHERHPFLVLSFSSRGGALWSPTAFRLLSAFVCHFPTKAAVRGRSVREPSGAI